MVRRGYKASERVRRTRYQQARKRPVKIRTKRKKIIEMEQCAHCEAWQIEPGSEEIFICESCGGIAI